MRIVRKSVGLLAVMLVPVLGEAEVWTEKRSMTTPRTIHTATLLCATPCLDPTAKVLVVGGGYSIDWGYMVTLASAELYDPAALDPLTLTTGTWTPTGSMAMGRSGHTATRLQTGPNAGKVLVVGGNGTSAELYDPDAIDSVTGMKGTWEPTGSVSTGRPYGYHTATLLLSGKVLATGGYPAQGNSLDSAELYDPDAIDSVTGIRGTWSDTGPLTTTRAGHTATLLPSGKVLVAGGYSYPGILASAELYDPERGTWDPTGSLTTEHIAHTATLIETGPNAGKVLVVGGGYGPSSWYPSMSATAELYDPAARTWSVTDSLTAGRGEHTATLLPSGKVLVAGGRKSSPDALSVEYPAGAELYNSNSGAWNAGGTLATARSRHTATLLPSGKVLVAGGDNSAQDAWQNASATLSSAELH